DVQWGGEEERHGGRSLQHHSSFPRTWLLATISSRLRFSPDDSRSSSLYLPGGSANRASGDACPPRPSPPETLWLPCNLPSSSRTRTCPPVTPVLAFHARLTGVRFDASAAGSPSSTIGSWPSLLNTKSSPPSPLRSVRHTACVL